MARVAKRARRRLACRLVVGRQRFSGVILDLSASGIFVQTNAKPRPGDAVSLELSMPGQREPLRLEAQVARVKVVPARLVAVAQGGLGLRITNAPEGYFGFLTAILPDIAAAAEDAAQEFGMELEESAPAAAAPAAPATRRYRVHVSLVGGARSRTLRIEAGSADEAGARALETAGEGWKLLGAVLEEEPAAG